MARGVADAEAGKKVSELLPRNTMRVRYTLRKDGVRRTTLRVPIHLDRKELALIKRLSKHWDELDPSWSRRKKVEAAVYALFRDGLTAERKGIVVEDDE